MMDYNPVEYVRELMDLADKTEVKIRARIDDLGIPAEKFVKIHDPEELRKMLKEFKDYLKDGDQLQFVILVRAPYGQPGWILSQVNYRWENDKWVLESETFSTEGDYVGGSPPGWFEETNEKVDEFIKKYGANIKPGTGLSQLAEDLGLRED